MTRPPHFEPIDGRVDDFELAHALALIADFVRTVQARPGSPKWTADDMPRYRELTDSVRAERARATC